MRHLSVFLLVLLVCSALNSNATDLCRKLSADGYRADTACCDSIDSIIIQPYDSLVISCDSAPVMLSVPYDSCYNYVWYRNGSPIFQIGLENILTTTTPGTYYVVVSNNCYSATSNVVTVVINPPIYYTSSITNVSCYGLCNGSVTITPHGGASPYSIIWSGGSTSFTRTNLCAGVYTFVISDSLGCVDTGQVVISQPSALIVGGYCTCGTKTCIMTALPSGGSAPYSYLWSNGQTTQTVTVSKFLRSVTVTVTDANGCTQTRAFLPSECGSKSAEVEEPIEQSIRVYPNPISEYISIEFPDIPAEIITMKILDVTGRTVYEVVDSTPDGKVYIINTKSIPSGIYFVRIESGSEYWVNRIIKE